MKYLIVASYLFFAYKSWATPANPSNINLKNCLLGLELAELRIYNSKDESANATYEAQVIVDKNGNIQKVYAISDLDMYEVTPKKEVFSYGGTPFDHEKNQLELSNLPHSVVASSSKRLNNDAAIHGLETMVEKRILELSEQHRRDAKEDLSAYVSDYYCKTSQNGTCASATTNTVVSMQKVQASKHNITDKMDALKFCDRIPNVKFKKAAALEKEHLNALMERLNEISKAHLQIENLELQQQAQLKSAYDREKKLVGSPTVR